MSDIKFGKSKLPNIHDLLITSTYDSYDVEQVVFVGSEGVLLRNLTTTVHNETERFVKKIPINSIVYSSKDPDAYSIALKALHEKLNN